MRIAIVGGGLSGLAVALGCEEAGHDVSLYEASDQLGGRMMTRPEGQHLIDLGFHVLHTAYPALKRWVDVPGLRGKPMDACTMTIQPSTGRRRVLVTPSKRLATFCPRCVRLASSMACASYAGAWAPRPKIWSAQWTV